MLVEDYGIDVQNERVSVSPKDLNIGFDVVPHDGSIPSAGDPELWFRMFQVISTNPYLTQQLDVVRIFKHGARMAGAKNINDFVRKGGNVNTQVMPDEQVQEGVESGQLSPIG